MTLSSRKLALIVWGIALLGIFTWWPLSYHYSGGFSVPLSSTGQSGPSRRGKTEPGIAVISGMGKFICFISWKSRFTRNGVFFDPINPHEFPHPWFGFQNQGGRLWVSFPVALVAIATALAAWAHLGWKKRRLAGDR